MIFLKLKKKIFWLHSHSVKVVYSVLLLSTQFCCNSYYWGSGCKASDSVCEHFSAFVFSKKKNIIKEDGTVVYSLHVCSLFNLGNMFFITVSYKLKKQESFSKSPAHVEGLECINAIGEQSLLPLESWLPTSQLML